MSQQSYYIMHPNLHAQLSFVRGFNKMNGDRYQDHIIMIFSDLLNESDKKRILESNQDEKALEILDELDINYTHNMEES